jgi:hypothetical protein
MITNNHLRSESFCIEQYLPINSREVELGVNATASLERLLIQDSTNQSEDHGTYNQSRGGTHRQLQTPLTVERRSLPPLRCRILSQGAAQSTSGDV